MKKYIKITIFILVITISLLLLYTLLRTDELKFKDDYLLYNFATYSNGKQIKLSIPSKNNVKYLKGNQVIKKISQETGFFYFGYNSCPWCRNIVETLIEVAVENNITFYYINIKDLSNNELKSIISYLKEYLRKTEANEERLYVPDVYIVKNGKIINHHIGSVESQKNPFNKLKGKDKDNLKNIYLDFIKEMNK